MIMLNMLMSAVGMEKHAVGRFDMSETKNQERPESLIQVVWHMSTESVAMAMAYICGLLRKYIILILQHTICLSNVV